eukprot:1195800-Prorocentrum_minimum.AAC.4
MGRATTTKGADGWVELLLRVYSGQRGVYYASGGAASSCRSGSGRVNADYNQRAAGGWIVDRLAGGGTSLLCRIAGRESRPTWHTFLRGEG